LITIRLSQEGCISLVTKGRSSRIAHKHDWNKCEPPSTWETYSSKTSLSKIQNVKHKYKTTKIQLLKKISGE
jgi:hypothetical protein